MIRLEVIMTVGERIKDMRKRKNITQVDLAKS